jgi:hypothetical protein
LAWEINVTVGIPYTAQRSVTSHNLTHVWRRLRAGGVIQVECYDEVLFSVPNFERDLGVG